MSSALTADPWETDLFDVESINAEVSNRVLAELARVTNETHDWAKTPRTSVTVALGPAGAGKTHLFARLRSRVGLGACFVHVRPLFATTPSPRLVLGQTLDALGTRTTSSGLTQIDVLAGSVLGRALGLGRNRPNVAIEDLREAPDRDRRLAGAAEVVERHVRGLHGPTLRHVLRLPFAEGVERQARLRLLEGEELTDEEAHALGMRTEFPVRLSDMDVTRAIATLARLASLGAPLVIAFDQLENLDPGDESPRVRAFGHLLAELHDTAPGMVILLLALDDLWRLRIAPALPEAVLARIGRETRALRNPTPDEKDALLIGWRARDPGLQARPFPSPFSDAGWSAWRAETSATPRILLEELDAWLDGRRGEAAPVAEEVDPREAVDAELTRCVEAVHDEIRRAGTTHTIPTERLRSALDQVLRLAGAVVDVTAPDELQARVGCTSRRIVMAQQSNHTSLAAALKRAQQDPPAWVVRESRVPLRASWSVCRVLQSELESGGRWLWLTDDDVAWALGAHDLMAAGRSGDVVDARGRSVPAATVEARCVEIASEGSLTRALLAAVASRPQSSKNTEAAGDPRPKPRDPVASPPEAPRAATPRGPVASAPDASRAAAAKSGGKPSAPSRASAAMSSVPAPATTAAGAIVSQLGVASVDRVLRELRREVPEATRAMVIEQLEADASVELLGPSLVAKKALRS